MLTNLRTTDIVPQQEYLYMWFFRKLQDTKKCCSNLVPCHLQLLVVNICLQFPFLSTISFLQKREPLHISRSGKKKVLSCIMGDHRIYKRYLWMPYLSSDSNEGDTDTINGDITVHLSSITSNGRYIANKFFFHLCTFLKFRHWFKLEKKERKKGDEHYLYIGKK